MPRGAADALRADPRDHARLGQLTADYSLYRTINGLSASRSWIRSQTRGQRPPDILIVPVAMTFLLPWAGERWERRNGAVLGTTTAAARC